MNALIGTKKAARTFYGSLLEAKTADLTYCQAAANAVRTILEQGPLFSACSVLFAFYSLKTEIPTQPILHAALEKGKQIALPRMRKTECEIDFYYLDCARPLEKQLEQHPFGIKEPLENLQKALLADIPQNAAVLVPGLAFTPDGRRLGHGKAYYDRFIWRLEEAQPHAQIPLIGTCFSFQLTENLPVEAHDRRVTHILTENGIFKTD